MEFDNNKSIFLQIADTISERVVQGAYPPGEKIPSVRELASDLGVNPNTIMRTYSELQASNIIENRRGIGYFVHIDAQKKILQKKRTEFFAKVLPEFLRHAGLLGITASDLKTYLDKLNIQHENK
jgi:DNA-binding transcriptional regulator YhcF (GntR family)